MQGIDSVSIVAALFILALIPFFAVMVTSYVKMVVVFNLLRNALGIQQIPPNIVVNGLAIVLTVFVMTPVGTGMYKAARAQGVATVSGLGELSAADLEKTAEPLKDFLRKHSHPATRLLFLKAASQLWGGDEERMPDPDGLLILAPSFMLSELTQAFQIGFLLYLPFIVVDLVISNILLAMGMMMMSPTTVSLPFKLLLFVMINGWTKVVEGLLATYR